MEGEVIIQYIPLLDPKFSAKRLFSYLSRSQLASDTVASDTLQVEYKQFNERANSMPGKPRKKETQT